MGTLFRIVAYGAEAERVRVAADAAFARVAALDAALSDWDEASELSRLSAASAGGPTAPIPVSEDLFRVLAFARTVSSATDGAFDVTVGPCVRLWRRSARQGTLPTRERLDAARAAVDWRAVELDDAARTARLARADMRLDLGGIAKGYGVDRAAAVLAGWGVTRGLVNVGGDLMALGVGPEGPWRVGVRDPRDPDGIVETLSLEDEAVATSGDYLRYFEHGGRRWHHLLDPSTGAPRISTLHTVTVRARDVRTADAAATAAFSFDGDPGSLSLSRRSDVRIVHRG